MCMSGGVKSPLAVLLLAMPVLAADFPEPAELKPIAEWPDPLVMRDGSRVENAADWTAKRKPELRALFEHYMYGSALPKPDSVKASLLKEDKQALGGAATLREFDVDLGLEQPTRLLVVTPNGKPGPVPCFLGINFNGNHQVLANPAIALPKSWVRPRKDGTGGNAGRDEDRGKETETWAVAQTIARGYAFAGFYHGDIVPDDAKLAEPVLAKLSGKPNRGPADTATIMAWAWGFSRMLDVLETLPEIDAKHVAAVGHSRNGKTALLAAAFDERFAMVIPSQAGSGGSGPSRVAPELAKAEPNGRPKAETVAVITKAFPHWFCGYFSQFGADPEKLPFDQHELVAMCAPRPVLFSIAEEDQWSNPPGQWQVLHAADPVYRLVAKDGIDAKEEPPITTLLNSRLGWFKRPGKHSMTTQDWSAWLDYADRWLR